MWKSILGLALALTTSTASAQPSSPFHRGVNVLGYDPYWTDESKRRFEWRHFREIHDAGFDFVRLNLQAFQRVFFNHDPDIVPKRYESGYSVLLNRKLADQCDDVLNK